MRLSLAWIIVAAILVIVIANRKEERFGGGLARMPGRVTDSLVDALQSVGGRIATLIRVGLSNVSELAEKAGLSAGKLAAEAADDVARKAPIGQAFADAVDGLGKTPTASKVSSTLADFEKKVKMDPSLAADLKNNGLPQPLVQRFTEAMGDVPGNHTAWDAFTKRNNLRWTGAPKASIKQRLTYVATWITYAASGALLAYELHAILQSLSATGGGGGGAPPSDVAVGDGGNAIPPSKPPGSKPATRARTEVGLTAVMGLGGASCVSSVCVLCLAIFAMKK